MPWKPGESGSPGSPPRQKPFLRALERAIASDEGKKLRRAADQLVELAAEGAPWAIAMLADRLDGKATQQIEMAIQRQVRDIDDAELADIAAGGRAGVAVPAQGEEVSSSLH